MDQQIILARDFAISHHGDQRYGEHPYSHHLDEVANEVQNWTSDPIDVMAAFLHDLYEDSPSDMEELRPIVRDTIDPTVDLIVHACSGFGPNRNVRNAMVMNNLVNYPRACLVKSCDRLVNMRNSRENLPSLFRKYQAELPKFLEVVGDHIPASLYRELSEMAY